MVFVERALKICFKPERAPVKPTQQPFVDDLSTVNGQSGVSGDDFFVDDLLDFSKPGIEDGILQEYEQQQEDKKGGFVFICPKQEVENDNSNPCISPFSDPDGQLCLPADELANLEWLSHFVDDSFSGYSPTYPAGKLSEKPSANRSEPEIPVPAKTCFTTPVQTKARSKRARTGGRIWILRSQSLTDSSASSSSSSSSSCKSSFPLNPWLIYHDPNQTAESQVGKRPVKKLKQKHVTEAGGGAQQARRCSHCLVQQTPQWRTGPLGAKTLCNACGVRYKSGRLLPEYRPACCPTFSGVAHSNNHRKVLEMRRKKEVEADLALPVQTLKK